MNIRAPIGNKARADAALPIHADGGPPGVPPGGMPPQAWEGHCDRA